MNINIFHQTTEGSLSGTMAFPKVVELLSKEGVESYSVDLVRMKKIFYMPNGETFEESFNYPIAQIAADFDPEAVKSAIRLSQGGHINYREFLSKVISAGTTLYTVYLQGKRAVYVGRNGDSHTEHFPR